MYSVRSVILYKYNHKIHALHKNTTFTVMRKIPHENALHVTKTYMKTGVLDIILVLHTGQSTKASPHETQAHKW